MINNLKVHNKHFVSDKTYIQGNRWASELNACVGSLDLIGAIDWFRVYQAENLRSDHALVALQISRDDICLGHVLR